MVRSRCRSPGRGLEVQAASAIVEAATSRADEEIRGPRADLRLAFAELVAAQTRERELTAARDRLRELADVLAKREAAGDAAGFDRLRAEREVLEIEADRATAATERARAQATLAGFFIGPVDPVDADRRAGAPLTDTLADRSRRSSNAPRPSAARRRRCARKSRRRRFAERAADRRWIPEPEMVAGTKSSIRGRRRYRQCVHGPRHDSAVRPWPARARAGAGAGQPGAGAYRGVSTAAARADRRAAGRRRSSVARQPSGTGRGARQRRSNRAHRAGQLRRGRARHPRAARCLSDAFDRARPAGDARRGRARRRRSNWNSSADGRSGDDDARHLVAVMVAACRRAAGGCRRQAAAPDHETPTLDVTNWTDKPSCSWSTRRSWPGRPRCFAVHLTQLADFKPVNAGKPSVEFTPEAGGAADASRGHASRSRPGAFRVEGAPPAAGRYRWALRARRARPVRPPRPRRDHGVRRREDGPRRGGKAAGRRRGGDRLLEGAAVDERVRHGAGARSRAANVDPRAGRRSIRSRAARPSCRAGGGPLRGAVAADDRHDRCAPGRCSAASSRG